MQIKKVCQVDQFVWILALTSRISISTKLEIFVGAGALYLPCTGESLSKERKILL